MRRPARGATEIIRALPRPATPRESAGQISDRVLGMGLKALIAARLDHRYARNRDIRSLSTQIADIELRVFALETTSGRIVNKLGELAILCDALQDQHKLTQSSIANAYQSDHVTTEELKNVMQIASEAKRLGSEAALAIQELLATELVHRQALDILNGNSR